jgi:hypothetical protein
MVWLYLAAKPSHVGVNVDGLACPLHYPMVHSFQMMGHCYIPPGLIGLIAYLYH